MVPWVRATPRKGSQVADVYYFSSLLALSHQSHACLLFSPAQTHMTLYYSIITQRESKPPHLQHIGHTDKARCRHHHEAPLRNEEVSSNKVSTASRCRGIAAGEKHVFLSTAAEQKSAAAEELVRNALLIFPLGPLSASEAHEVPARFPGDFVFPSTRYIRATETPFRKSCSL